MILDFHLNCIGKHAMKLRNIRSKRLASLCAALVFSGFSYDIFAASGKFQFVSGDVRVQTKTGEVLNVAKGTEVNEGDVIISGAPALAQLKMEDGGMLVIRPKTRLTISTYRFNGTEDGTERATYRLDRGTVRAITGQIGKTNKQNYLIQTPTASIGVRGTDHEPAFIPKNDDEYDGAKPGTYDKVNTGETYIETKGGLVIVKPNSVGFAEDESSVPTILPSIPGFYNKFTKKGSGSSEAAAASGFEIAGGRGPAPISISETEVHRPIHTIDGTNLSTVNVVLPNSENGLATLAAYTEAKKNSGFTQIEQTRSLKIDAGLGLKAETGSSPELRVNWGRWENGFVIDNVDSRGSLHFLNTSNLTTQTQLAALLPITATYGFVGGTRPTDEFGRVGDLTRISANVNFSTQQITDYTLSANNSGRTWDAHGSGTFGQFLSSNNGLRLDGLCTGCSTDASGNPITSTANGFAKGAFVGSQAQGLITTYGLQANEKGISGAAVLKRP
jgi:FecR protein